ncbi:hypothetical protein VUR80DRAFT_1246 [Thermomyces stellatus]
MPRVENPSSSFPPGEDMTSQRTESLESRMPDICVGYLLLDEIGKTNLFSEEQMAIETLPQASDLFRDEEGSIDYNFNCLWEDYEQDMIRCEPDGVWSQPPLSLRLMPLGSKLWDPVDTVFFFRLLMEHWADFAQWRDIWELAFGLVNGVVDTLVQDRCGNELLCLAARWGCMPIVHRLVAMPHHTELKRELLYGTRRERHLPSPAEWIHQSIGEAVLEDRIDDVEYLLQEDGIEAHISHINSRSENVLHLTSKFCHPAVFRLLIPHLPDGARQRHNQRDTPLMRVAKSLATSEDRYVSASILLSGWDGAQECHPHLPSEQHALLRADIDAGDAHMCELLTQVGRILPLSEPQRRGSGSPVPSYTSSEGKGCVDNPLGSRLTEANAASVLANSMTSSGQERVGNQPRPVGMFGQMGGTTVTQEAVREEKAAT